MLFFLLGVWLPRNGAKARLLASRSGVQRQPKRAPIRGRLAAESAAATRAGLGDLLRREGLYSSLLSADLLAARAGQRRPRGPDSTEPRTEVQTQSPGRGSPKTSPPECQNARLTEDLRKAHIIIEVQKKVAALLGNAIPELMTAVTQVAVDVQTRQDHPLFRRADCTGRRRPRRGHRRKKDLTAIPVVRSAR